VVQDLQARAGTELLLQAPCEGEREDRIASPPHDQGVARAGLSRLGRVELLEERIEDRELVVLVARDEIAPCLTQDEARGVEFALESGGDERAHALGVVGDEDFAEVVDAESRAERLVVGSLVGAAGAIDEDEAAYAVGEAARQIVRDHAAVGDPHHVHSLFAQVIEQRDERTRLMLDRVVGIVGVGPAEPEEVGHDQTMLLGEARDLLEPLPGRRQPEPMKEEDGAPLASALPVLDPVGAELDGVTHELRVAILLGDDSMGHGHEVATDEQQRAPDDPRRVHHAYVVTQRVRGHEARRDEQGSLRR